MQKSLIDLSHRLNIEYSGSDVQITGIAQPLDASESDVIFIKSRKVLKQRERIKSKIWVIAQQLMHAELTNYLSEREIYHAYVLDIEGAFYHAMCLFQTVQPEQHRVHPTADVDPKAEVDASVLMGAQCVVGAGTRIGSGTKIRSFVFIGSGVTIGADCEICEGVIIYPGSVIGDQVRIQAGTVIGSDGFGYYDQGGQRLRIPQIGNVVIGNEVDIGANCCIDRATLGSTTIHDGVKIDNLVQIAHNVSIGQNTVIAAQTGIAGSSVVGNNVIIAGQVGIPDHVKIGNGVTIAAQSGIIGDIADNLTISGYPARPHAEAMRTEAYIRKLPKIWEQLKGDWQPPAA